MLMTKLKTVLKRLCVNGQKVSPSGWGPRSSPQVEGWPLYCWARSAVLLAFIFSSRLARWLLVISISSILSNAVRNWRREEIKSLHRVRKKTQELYFRLFGEWKHC